jgi:hypothetical protein
MGMLAIYVIAVRSEYRRLREAAGLVWTAGAAKFSPKVRHRPARLEGESAQFPEAEKRAGNGAEAINGLDR